MKYFTSNLLILFFSIQINSVVGQANAGTITALEPSPCISFPATIEAIPDGNQIAPPPLQQHYVLATRYDLFFPTMYRIEDFNTEPIFTFNPSPDPWCADACPIQTYSIHTIVGEFSDTNSADYIDLSQYTYISQLESLFMSGGGSIQGDVDIQGADINFLYGFGGFDTFEDKYCLDLKSFVTIDLLMFPYGTVYSPEFTLKKIITDQSDNILFITEDYEYNISQVGTYKKYMLIGQLTDPTDIHYVDLNSITNISQIQSELMTKCGTISFGFEFDVFEFCCTTEPVNFDANPIPFGDYFVDPDINSSGRIKPLRFTNFVASDAIILEPGFTVGPQTVFHAFIGQCY